MYRIAILYPITVEHWEYIDRQYLDTTLSLSAVWWNDEEKNRAAATTSILMKLKTP